MLKKKKERGRKGEEEKEDKEQEEKVLIRFNKYLTIKLKMNKIELKHRKIRRVS